MYTTRWKLQTIPFIAGRQARKLTIPIFVVFGLTRSGIKPWSTFSVADALSTRQLIVFLFLQTTCKLVSRTKINSGGSFEPKMQDMYGGKFLMVF